MHGQRPSAFGFAIAKKLMWPPALEISAPPDRGLPDVRQFQCAIDPTSTAPAWRANVPVRMIIKRNQRDRFVGLSKPQSRQMMKVARTVENEFAEMRLDLAIKLFNRSWRGGKTKVWSPFGGINPGQIVCDLAPGIVQIEMNRTCVHHGLRPRLETRFASRDNAQVFRRTGEIGITHQRFKRPDRGDVLHIEDRANYSLGGSQNQR